MLSINDIVESMRQSGIAAEAIPNRMTYKLTHNLSKSDFEQTIRGLLGQWSLNPQRADWMPGSPTGNDEDWGFYVYPKFPDDWEEGDFDLCIAFDEIYWC